MRPISMINFGPKKEEEKETPEPTQSSASGIKFGPKPSVATTPKEPVKPTHTVKPTDVKGIFGASTVPIIEDITSRIVQTNPKFADQYKNITAMVGVLIKKDVATITNWGSEDIEAQRYLIDMASNRMGEFSGYNGSALLEEVLNFSKGIHTDTSFFKRLSGKANNLESYMSKITTLKFQIKEVMPELLRCRELIKESKLGLYLAVLAGVADNLTLDDHVVEEAFYNRRVLITGALTNLQMLSAKLDSTIELASRMQTEASRMVDVVLPALKMKDN